MKNDYTDYLFRYLHDYGIEPESIFHINPNGSLHTTVHTGRKLEAFELDIMFRKNVVTVLTHSFIGVENDNYFRMNVILTSINSINNQGTFYIDDENRIAFLYKSSFSKFLSIKNPFDWIFYGCEEFGMYEESILKSLMGSYVFYVNGI